jgi:phosphoglycerate dehydrogenase-like enzyme
MAPSRIVVHAPARLADVVAPALRAAASSDVLDCREPAECAKALADADVLCINNASYDATIARSVGGATKLRWLHFLSSGTDALLRNGGARPGLIVTNAAEAIGPIVAEHALALALALVRALPAMEAAKRARAWSRDAVTAALSSLDGASVTVLGYGMIGRAIVERAQVFGARCTVVRRTGRGTEASSGITFTSLDEALVATEVLFVAVPLTSETKGLLDGRRLGLLPANAYLVNVARGAVIDQAALVEALRARRLAGAALDVFDEEPLPGTSPLWTLDKVIVSPHVAGLGSDRVYRRIADICVRNLHAFEAGTLVDKLSVV